MSFEIIVYMENVVLYSSLSVLAVSLMSLVGILTLSLSNRLLNKFLIYMISFSTGALFGDAFIHLLPEIVERYGFTVNVSIFIMSGIVFSFIIEKFIHWRHCHHPTTHNHPHPFAVMNLVGDVVHNLIDGLIIGASYLISIPVGFATTIAVILHEIPQEIGDFGVLVHGGFSKKKALLLNFLTALVSFIGLFVALYLGGATENITLFLVPFAAGNFIYIAGSDLIPELHKEVEAKKSLAQLLSFILGIGVMFLLLFVEFV